MVAVDRARPSPSAALTEIQLSGDLKAETNADKAAESEYVPSARMASVLTPRSESRARASRRVSAVAPRLAESACGFVSPRTAHDRTSGERSLVNATNAGTAAGSRGRKSDHVARHRMSSSGDFVQRTIGAR